MLKGKKREDIAVLDLSLLLHLLISWTPWAKEEFFQLLLSSFNPLKEQVDYGEGGREYHLTLGLTLTCSVTLSISLAWHSASISY